MGLLLCCEEQKYGCLFVACALWRRVAAFHILAFKRTEFKVIVFIYCYLLRYRLNNENAAQLETLHNHHIKNLRIFDTCPPNERTLDSDKVIFSVAVQMPVRFGTRLFLEEIGKCSTFFVYLRIRA